LHTVVNCNLSTETDFYLKKIPAAHCIKETPFYLFTPELDTAGINRILADTAAYQLLIGKQLQGYLTGFIDLICFFEGKYYLIDYKTNALSDYGQANLLQAMREHNYGLQYWLYTLVLDQYLRQRLPDYDYTRHFGGVKYLFLRGMQIGKPGYAIFADFPDQHKLKQLAKLFFSGKK
jgi:exodeoxyribonuclease V beta subunit